MRFGLSKTVKDRNAEALLPSLERIRGQRLARADSDPERVKAKARFGALHCKHHPVDRRHRAKNSDAAPFDRRKRPLRVETSFVNHYRSAGKQRVEKTRAERVDERPVL